MHRRALIVSGLALLGSSACASTPPAEYATRESPDGPGGPPPGPGDHHTLSSVEPTVARACSA